MKKLICLVGETARGRDTLARIIKNNGKQFVCDYTTRKKRDDEVDGESHYFVTQEDADDILEYRRDEVFSYTQIGDNVYFSMMEDVEDRDVFVTDPAGIQYIKEHHPQYPIYVVYVTSKSDVAITRAIKRGDRREHIVNKMKNESLLYKDFKDFDVKFDNSGPISRLYEFAESL